MPNLDSDAENTRVLLNEYSRLKGYEVDDREAIRRLIALYEAAIINPHPEYYALRALLISLAGED